MKHVEQKPVWYPNYTEVQEICFDMEKHIADGWRVHTCLESSSRVIVVYERELEVWN